MKKYLDKKALMTSLLACCTFLPAHASTMLSNSKPGWVTIPTFCAKYELSASLFWLQPTSSSLDYGIHTNPLPIFNPHWIIRTLNPDYKAGFDVGMGYVFPDSANDLRLTWSHLTDSGSDHDSDASPNFMGPFFQIGPNSNTIHSVEGSTKFRYNLINLEVGQFVNFGCRMQTRFFTGLSSVFLTQHLTSFIAGSNDPFFSLQTNNISKYSGVGPRFGMASTYLFTPRFGLVAQIAGSAYVGRLRTSLESIGTASILISEGITSNPQSINTDNINRLVPGADGKLGLNYQYQYGKNCGFKLEAGYQFATFFNAIREVFPSTLAEVDGIISPIQTGGIFVGTMGQSQSNFAVSGPYLNGSVAF